MSKKLKKINQCILFEVLHSTWNWKLKMSLCGFHTCLHSDARDPCWDPEKGLNLWFFKAWHSHSFTTHSQKQGPGLLFTRNLSRLQCFIMVSRKTRRVSKVNTGGQLPEVGFDQFFVNKWFINRYQSFCTPSKSPQIPNLRGGSLEKCSLEPD